MKNNAHRGFTLVEVLMVIVIIGALAGFTYLTLGKSDEGVKSKACGGNREAIKMAYSMYLFDSGKKSTEYTLQNFIDDKYQGIVENNKTTCPSDGTYSAESAIFNTVVCSKHKDEISSYTYRTDSWADMDEDRAAFLSQLVKDIQSAYSKLAELFPNHAARLASLKELAGGTNITVNGEALRVMDEIAKLTAQLNLSSFLSTSTNALSDYKIGLTNGQITAIAIKAGKESGANTNDVYVYYPGSGSIYYCKNDINRDSRQYLQNESLAAGYAADSATGWKKVQ